MLKAATKIQSKRIQLAPNQEHKKILQKLHLNIGCSQTYYEDALNIDIDSNSRADLVINIDQPWEVVKGYIYSRTDQKYYFMNHSSMSLMQIILCKQYKSSIRQ